jgi:transcriptional regulator with PAS, ATPase and Fis domain
MAMEKHRWIEEFPGAVTVCDTQGIILEMNARARHMFREQGGGDLIGRNLFDCHPEPAQAKLRQLLESREANVYTIEKNGVRRLIHQSPWYADGQLAGLVELVLEVPLTIPHFVRESSG